jgi:hypothetical protein
MPRSVFVLLRMSGLVRLDHVRSRYERTAYDVTDRIAQTSERGRFGHTKEIYSSSLSSLRLFLGVESRQKP